MHAYYFPVIADPKKPKGSFFFVYENSLTRSITYFRDKSLANLNKSYLISPYYSKCGKILTRTTPNTDTIYAVTV